MGLTPVKRECAAGPGSGDLIPGFDGSSPIRDAFRTASGTFLTMLGFAIIIIGALLPWGLLATFGLWIYPIFRKRRATVKLPDVAVV